MQSPTLLHYFSILIMNTLPIKNLANKHLRCLATILVVLFLSSFYAAHAQESLPVKDYSVGNQFVYSGAYGYAEEHIIADTLVRGVRYGVVESSYRNSTSRYYMRSTETSIYQYDFANQRENLVYSFGQQCGNNLGMNWISANLAYTCGLNNIWSNPIMLSYGDVNYLTSNSPNSFIRYVKPFGVTEYGDKYCHQEYFPGHSTRPPQYSEAGWYTVCLPNSSGKLVSAIIRGKFIVMNGNIDSYYLCWYAPTSIIGYQQTLRVSPRLTNALNGLPADKFGRYLVRCMLTVDTSLVDIVSIQTANGNRPDSTRYTNGKALLYCSFSVSNDSSEVGYIAIKSKTATDTTLSLGMENYVVIPTPSYVTTSTLVLSLQKAKLNFSINTSSPSTNNYGDLRIILFGMQSIFTPSALPPPTYTLSLDTTGLDSIQIVAANSEAPIIPDKVTYSGGKAEYVFSRPTVQSYPFTAGRLRFRSKSLQARENVLSILTSNTSTGIDYIPASITLKQAGVAAFDFQPDFVSQLEQGKNLVKHLAPNPATDVLTVRYAMGNSADNVQLELVNMLGTVQKSVTLANYDYGVHDIVMDVSDIAPGIYLLRVRSNGNVETQKVLIGR